ncbi:basic proline-rich protein-like [Frankliniella occidentalis]|uniref:Basic proline-rich protein-like n=1 Tax=Frankliniella occidentalis TaxID=133901 RepID=A0A9C6X991_FRAOC|nr:basic proline-rich protein-like [Frankliniella occidentalis]
MASSCLLNFARYPPQPQGAAHPHPPGGAHPGASPQGSPQSPVDVIAEDDDDDEVLSVGSEPRAPDSAPGSPRSPPRSPSRSLSRCTRSPRSPGGLDECCDLPGMMPVPCVPTIGALKFSIANILRPEFGAGRPSSGSRTPCRTAGPPPSTPASALPPAPIDLSRVSSTPVQPPPPPPSVASVASSSSSSSSSTDNGSSSSSADPLLWPAWVYCTRYSDRPSSAIFRILQSCKASSFEGVP